MWHKMKRKIKLPVQPLRNRFDEKKQLCSLTGTLAIVN